MTESLVKAMQEIEYNLEDYPREEVVVNDEFNVESFLAEFSSTHDDWKRLMKTLCYHD